MLAVVPRCQHFQAFYVPSMCAFYVPSILLSAVFPTAWVPVTYDHSSSRHLFTASGSFMTAPGAMDSPVLHLEKKYSK